MNKLCYVASRITDGAGDEIEIEQNVLASIRGGLKVLELGYYPILPAINNHLLGKVKNWQHAGYMQMDKEVLRQCKAVYFMTGWQQSKGAKMEHRWARQWNKVIIYETE